MAYDPLGLDQAETKTEGYDPLGLGIPIPEPSYLEAAKVGLKKGLAGAARMYEIPVRAAMKLAGVDRQDIYPSTEWFGTTPEEEERVGKLGIPGQLVAGAVGLPGAALKYGPLMAAAPAGIVGTGLTFAGETAAERLSAGEKISPVELGEEAIIGGIFRGIEPLGRLARSAILSGTFGTQAFADTYAQTKNLEESLKAAIAPGVIGAGLGLMGKGRKKEILIPEAGAEPMGWERGLPWLREPFRPERPNLPAVTRQGWAEPPTEMVWNARTGRYEPGDYWTFESVQPGEGPGKGPTGPDIPPPESGGGGGAPGKYGTWRYNPKTKEWVNDLGQGPPIMTEPRDWVREGREYPPPKYPPTVFQPGVKPGAYDPLDLGPTPGIEPRLPGEKLVYGPEIYELKDIVMRAQAPGKRGLETLAYDQPETVSWGSSFPPFITEHNKTAGKKNSWNKSEVIAAIDKGMNGKSFDKAPKQQEIWNAVKAEARGLKRDRLAEQRRELQKKDPTIESNDTISRLTESFDDEIMGFKEELRDEGWSEKTIARAIEEARTRIESEEVSPDFEGIKKAFATESESITPLLSPTARRQYKLLPAPALTEPKPGIVKPEGPIGGDITWTNPKTGIEYPAEVISQRQGLEGPEFKIQIWSKEEGKEGFWRNNGWVKENEIRVEETKPETVVPGAIAEPEAGSPGPSPELSPTAKDQFKLPGMKIGLKEGKGAVAPTLEGSPLMQAAITAEKEKVQPGLPIAEAAPPRAETVTEPPSPAPTKPEPRQPIPTPEGIEFVDKEGNAFKPLPPEPEAPAIDFSSPDAFRKFVEGKGAKWPVKGPEADTLKREFDSLKPGPQAIPPEKVGLAYVKDKARYFTDSREITKGKNKGKVEITLTDGKKVVVGKDDIKRARAEFKTGEAPAEPLDRESIQGFADERLKTLANSPEIEIVDRAEIPERLANQIDENLQRGIKGVYDPNTRKIYLVREMMGDEMDVISAINHEAVGHYAMESFLGREGDKFFNRVWLKYGRKGLGDIAEERGFDLNTDEGRIDAAKEKIARLSETGGDPGLLKQFYAWVREQIRKIFPGKSISDAEIQTTIKKAREFLISGEAKAMDAKMDGLRRHIAAVSRMELNEPPLPAQFSIGGAFKETGKSAYREEVEPKIKGIWATWEGLKKALSPTSGVDVKDMNIMMKFLGDREAAKARVEVLTEKGVNLISKLSPAEQIDFINKVQAGRTKDLPLNLQEIAKLHRTIEDSLFENANSILQKSDTAAQIEYLKDHVRNIWKVVPKGLEEEIQKRGFSGLGRRPLEGSRAPLHHQYYTLSEGMEKGGVPFTTNLLEITRLNHADTMKLVTAHNMWNGIGEIGHRQFIKLHDAIPEGFRPLNDRIANKYFPPKQAGRWVVEDNVGRLLENYLSRDYVRENPALRGIMGIKNITTALELGFSAFHASFITWEAIASQLELGMRRIVNQGQIMRGLKDILEAPISPISTYKVGRDVGRLFRNPDEFLTSTAGQKFAARFPEAKETLGHLFWGGGSVRMSEAYKISSLNVFKENLNSKNYVGAALRSIPALSQWMMKPLFENYIPSIKRAVFFKEFSNELVARQADIATGKLTKPEIARDIWSFVENRFGEMNFDNLWWNRTMKSALQLVVRSVTWKLGNIRGYGKAVTGQSAELIGALKEGRMPRLTREMAWVWGLAIVTSAMAGVVQYAFTGKHPETWKDMVYPRIDEQEGRLSLPTYMRDIFHMGHAPVKYVTSSLAGWIGRFGDILQNKDFYGVQIHDPNENVLNQRIDDLIHMVPLPFSVQSYKRMKEEGQAPEKKFMGGLGFTKAPYWIERSSAEQKASELKAAHLPVGGRSPEDFQRGQLVKNYARRYQEATLKGGPTDEIMSEFHEDVRSGKLYARDFLSLRQRISKEPLDAAVAHLPFKDVLEVWKVASTEERKRLAPILMRKYMGLRSPEDRMLYLPKIREIRSQMMGGA